MLLLDGMRRWDLLMGRCCSPASGRLEPGFGEIRRYYVSMGTRRHILTLIDEQSKRATCSICGEMDVRLVRKRGSAYWTCRTLEREHAERGRRKRGIPPRNLSTEPRRKPHVYSKHKGDTCAMCGFVPEHTCQLDVDHIDGDCTNDDPTNLQTLCANCHRLKTYRQVHSRP